MTRKQNPSLAQLEVLLNDVRGEAGLMGRRERMQFTITH